MKQFYKTKMSERLKIGANIPQRNHLYDDFFLMLIVLLLFCLGDCTILIMPTVKDFMSMKIYLEF
jgi:hypothetical protein